MLLGIIIILFAFLSGFLISAYYFPENASWEDSVPRFTRFLNQFEKFRFWGAYTQNMNWANPILVEFEPLPYEEGCETNAMLAKTFSGRFYLDRLAIYRNELYTRHKAYEATLSYDQVALLLNIVFRHFSPNRFGNLKYTDENENTNLTLAHVFPHEEDYYFWVTNKAFRAGCRSFTPYDLAVMADYYSLVPRAVMFEALEKLGYKHRLKKVRKEDFKGTIYENYYPNF